MKEITALNIASLLNLRNKLPEKLSKHLIMEGNYFYVETESPKESYEIIACVQVKKLSFFGVELKHLAVNPSFERKGFAKLMIEKVEDHARRNKIPLICATTRPENDRMNYLLLKSGYKTVNDFRHPNTGSALHLWNKIIEQLN